MQETIIQVKDSLKLLTNKTIQDRFIIIKSNKQWNPPWREWNKRFKTSKPKFPKSKLPRRKPKIRNQAYGKSQVLPPIPRINAVAFQNSNKPYPFPYSNTGIHISEMSPPCTNLWWSPTYALFLRKSLFLPLVFQIKGNHCRGIDANRSLNGGVRLGSKNKTHFMMSSHEG